MKCISSDMIIMCVHLTNSTYYWTPDKWDADAFFKYTDCSSFDIIYYPIWVTGYIMHLGKLNIVKEYLDKLFSCLHTIHSFGIAFSCDHFLCHKTDKSSTAWLDGLDSGWLCGIPRCCSSDLISESSLYKTVLEWCLCFNTFKLSSKFIAKPCK